MFSKLTKETALNIDDEELLDYYFLEPISSIVQTGNEFQRSNYFSLRKVLTDLPKYCDYDDSVDISDCYIRMIDLYMGTFKVDSFEEDLELHMTIPRTFFVSFLCQDCNEVHQLISPPCDFKFKFQVKYSSNVVAKYEKFPDELPYNCYSHELLTDNRDWRVENELYRLLDEDIDRNEVKPFEEQREPFALIEKQQEMQLNYCLRNFTLAEHMERFYGPAAKTEYEFEETLEEFLANDENINGLSQALVNFFY
ncbi:unnamed protein product [Auanema sp. JU1783]|nr:unnamed protein product [Auanema sp. JU1783]